LQLKGDLLQPPTGHRELVPGVTVIVPHGGADRLALLQTTLPRLRQLRGIARVVLVELDTVPRAAEFGRRCADFHVFVPGAPPFHKSRAMNIGLAFVRTTHFLWLDSDMLLPDDFVTDALQECVARDLDCLVPWTEVHYLSQADSRKVALGDCAPAACVPVNRFVSSIMVPGSAVLIRTDFMHRHGGMSEQFRGWGCEDTAWYLKVRMLGSIGAPEQGPRIAHHLYHPTSGGYDDFKDLFKRPEYRRNFAILSLMKSYQTPDGFTRRFPPPPYFTAPWTDTKRFACGPGAEAIGQALRDLYGNAVSLCAPGAQADATPLSSSTDDAWDAALAAICHTEAEAPV
jgi:hypothetical protein